MERKMEVLENQGLPINYFNEDNEEEKKSENNESTNKKYNDINNINNLNKQFMSKSTRGFYPKLNNCFFPLEKNNNEENNINQLKGKKKPSINQFEFINKINSEKKKLNINEIYPQNINIHYSSNILQKRKIKSVNMELNDSFRHKNIKQSKNADLNNINKKLKLKPKSFKEGINRKNLEELYDEFPFAHKTNHRTSEELKDFLKEKKLKQKKEEEDILLQKHKKLFLLYKNLCNLNSKDFSKPTPSLSDEQIFSLSPPSTKTPTSRSKPISNKQNINLYLLKNESNNSNNSSNNYRKKKEKNQFYIGNDSSVKNNNSTLIDANEYYLNVLESQQLFVNSGLNKIENFLDTSDENDNDTNDLNVSKEQIQKIITKEKNSSEKKNKSNLVLNTNEFDELKKKFEKTLKRAEKIFSKKFSEEKSNNSNNIKEGQKDKNDNNKIKDKESNNINNIKKEKEKNINNNKKNNTKSPEINIESSNKIQPKLVDNNNEETSGQNTKEKNFPSLSHTFNTNSNPNKKLDIEIEPRAVFNLVEIIKFIIQRKVFLLLYETYISRAIRQQYVIAFSFFVAICKQYPFKKLEEYCNYITYKYAFRHLFKPYVRRSFRQLRKFFFLKRKIEFLVMRLNKLFNKKIFQTIKNFFRLKRLIKSLKPFLKSNFILFKKNIKLKAQNNDKDKESSENKNNLKNVEEKNLNKYLEPDIKDDDIDKSDYDLFQKRKNDDSVKMNSYLYESFGSDSKSLSVEPNSENNDKLHQMKMMLLIKNNIYNDDDSHNLNLDSISNSLNNSAQKITSKKNKKKLNPRLDISDDDENKFQDIKSEIKKEDEKEKINEEEKISIDISAERDNNDIEWEYDINKNEKDKKEKDKYDKKDKIKKREIIDEDYNDFEKDINFINNEENKEKEKIENIKIVKPIIDQTKLKLDQGIETENQKEKQEHEKFSDNKITSESKQTKEKPISSENEKEKKSNTITQTTQNKDQLDNILDNKSTIKNINQEKQIELLKQNLNDNKTKEEEVILSKKESEEKLHKELLSKTIKELKNVDILVSSLTEEIISNLITSEIKSPKKRLIPLKKFKFDKFEKASTQNALNSSFGSAGNAHDHLSKEFGLSGLSNQLSLADELLSLNDSLMSNYSSNSVFNKTIKDKKKEQSINLYFKRIAPKLIKLIRKEIISKYNLIYENISTPMKNNSEKLMMSLALQDAELLRNNYKSTDNLISISKILDKEKILKTFEPINKKIRSNDNVTSDNFYDKMLNDCIIETAIEIINKERYYGKNGEPLKWSARTHELAFKYKKNEPKQLADFVCNKLIFYIKRKVGLISDNCDEMTMEQINIEKDKRLTEIIKRDFDENEYQWNNLEMEETQLKVDNTEQIMEQLYNEVIEILEHIQYSRTKPELYQNKSIYACEEIPKLDFQITTTEDANLGEGIENINNNDKINI